jgi:D-alanine-D-alanine ligase
MAKRKTKVALLLGGDSSEREISLKTARAMHGALPDARYEAHLYDVRDTGELTADLPLDSERLAEDEIQALLDWWQKAATAKKAHTLKWGALGDTLQKSGADVVLSALHGGWGEDGTVQTLLEVAGLKYVGSPARASSIAMDKQLAKAIIRDAGIPVARGALLNGPEAPPPFAGACVVKPNAGGSSVGVTILRDGWSKEDWQTAVEAAFADGSGVIVEEFIEGQEVTAAVLGVRESARPLPIVEVVPQGDAEFYDFKAKYAAGGSAHVIPPRLAEEVQARIQRHALSAFRALGCRGVARADFIVTPNGTPYFLEINTLPGMTPTSLVPDAAGAAGISFEELVEKLVADALQ